MTSKLRHIAACFAVLAVTASPTFTQPSIPNGVSGTISDFSAGGSWYITAEWSLHVKGQSGKADFSAALTMVRSDLWILTTSADQASETVRGFHTHHVTIADGNVTSLANGFRVSGTAVITGDGNAAGFSPAPVQVDITGGNAVTFSNIKVTFAGGAVGHFGAQGLDGVVVTVH